MDEEPSHSDVIATLLQSVLPPSEERLESEGEIARGGMATIEVAVDRALHRRVAIKLLRTDHVDSALAVRSFLREAQITGQLDHPNIVPIHDIGVDARGRPYFTMKLVEGRSLHDLIEAVRATHERSETRGVKTASAVEHDELLRLLEVYNKVLDAVAFAHSRGVVHLDLKPENVLVGDYGQAYLMDWGIAKILPAPPGGDPLGPSRRVHDVLPLGEQPEHVIMGTPAYMSPEQARGDQRAIDTRADIFALGAMLFEILTGHPPYQGRSAVDVLMQAEDCAATLPKDLRIARELRRIVGLAMGAQPGERYQRVQDLQVDVHRFIRGGGNFPRQIFAAGEWIIREHEVGNAAYILMSGTCEVFKHIDGRWQSLRTLGPGEVFGETAILASSPRTASVVAITEVSALVVTREVLEREVDAMKPWMGAFIRALAQRFSESEERRRLAALQLPGRHDPAAIANQAMMVLELWGKWDRDLGATMGLARICNSLETSLGVPRDEVVAALASFEQFVVDRPHDLVSLRDKRSLKATLERALTW